LQTLKLKGPRTLKPDLVLLPNLLNVQIRPPGSAELLLLFRHAEILALLSVGASLPILTRVGEGHPNETDPTIVKTGTSATATEKDTTGIETTVIGTETTVTETTTEAGAPDPALENVVTAGEEMVCN
jgi:hypothetical protein